METTTKPKIKKSMNKLILGDGLLGSELVKQTNWDFISRKKNSIDFTNINSYKKYLDGYDVIINCIGYCNTYEIKKEKHWNINYKGVVDLVDYAKIYNTKVVHISTDYMYANSKPNASEKDVPVHCENWYSYTKLLADAYVQLKLNNYLVFRGTHKKNPFPYDEGLINQIGNFEYVDKVCEIMIDLINGNANGIYNIGTEIKTMYELSKITRKNVTPVNKKFNPVQPLDVSMDLTKLKEWQNENN